MASWEEGNQGKCDVIEAKKIKSQEEWISDLQRTMLPRR